jgi:anti-sigma B factor antagonist
MSPRRFEPARPPRRPSGRPGSITVTGRSRRIGEHAREALGSACQIELVQGNPESTLTITGQLDISCSDRFIACLREARDREPEDLVIDLRGLTFIDSTGLSMLLKADALARQGYFRLHIVRSDADIVRAVLEATGVERYLPLVDEPPPGAAEVSAG